jgi:hypothetical protein
MAAKVKAGGAVVLEGGGAVDHRVHLPKAFDHLGNRLRTAVSSEISTK